MKLNWLDRIADWNPQMWREIKGRLKPRNLFIAGAISFLAQVLILLSAYSQLPIDKSESEFLSNKYCLGSGNYPQKCIFDTAGHVLINWSLWWQDIFLTFCWISIFALLVAGTYMLISDISKEERRGTLNFIRLSPRSEVSILTGKMLGVTILLYLVILLAIPLQLWAGLSAQIPLAKILSIYAIVAASCIFFYSGALLCSAVGAGRGGALAWLGSGAVFLFLWGTLVVAMSWSPVNNPGAWLRLFSPIDSILYLFESPEGYGKSWLDWQWYYLPVGASIVSLVGFTLLNYALWTYWIWQALMRCFRNPNTTILSKRQSYLLVACFEMTILGFAVQEQADTYMFWDSLGVMSFFNILLLFGLIAVLSPHRQALLDWARYRREGHSNRKGFWNRSAVYDLIWGEKSPAPIAMAINLAIASSSIAVWILWASVQDVDKTKVLFGVAFFVSLMMIYATLAQRMLLMKTKQRSLWATGTVTAAIFLPAIILGILDIDPDKNPTVWLFSTTPWMGLEYAATTTVFLALLSEWSVLILLNLQLTRQLRRAGESASKALFAGRPSMPVS